MSFNLDIKTLAFLATLVASACGIYYTMQGRIAAVESRVEVLEEDFADLEKKIKRGPKPGKGNRK